MSADSIALSARIPIYLRHFPRPEPTGMNAASVALFARIPLCVTRFLRWESPA